MLINWVETKVYTLQGEKKQQLKKLGLKSIMNFLLELYKDSERTAEQDTNYICNTRHFKVKWPKAAFQVFQKNRNMTLNITGNSNLKIKFELS